MTGANRNEMRPCCRYLPEAVSRCNRRWTPPEQFGNGKDNLARNLACRRDLADTSTMASPGASVTALLSEMLGVMLNVVCMMMLGAWLQTSGRLTKEARAGLSTFVGVLTCAAGALLQGTGRGELLRGRAGRGRCGRPRQVCDAHRERRRRLFSERVNRPQRQRSYAGDKATSRWHVRAADDKRRRARPGHPRNHRALP